MNDEGESELETARTKGDVVKYVLVRCFSSKAVFAHMVPQKGLDEKNVACDFILGDLEWLGHTRIIMKSDNEPAVQALVGRVVELAKIECKNFTQLSKEQSAAYDSQSNGGTEVGVGIVRGLLRLSSSASRRGSARRSPSTITSCRGWSTIRACS